MPALSSDTGITFLLLPSHLSVNAVFSERLSLLFQLHTTSPQCVSSPFLLYFSSLLFINNELTIYPSLKYKLCECRDFCLRGSLLKSIAYNISCHLSGSRQSVNIMNTWMHRKGWIPSENFIYMIKWHDSKSLVPYPVYWLNSYMSAASCLKEGKSPDQFYMVIGKDFKLQFKARY